LTFKSGKLWIDDDQVPLILADQGWTARAAGTTRVGDIVVYKKDGKITHTGTVLIVDGAGNPSTIQSKWGQRGDYTHLVTQVPPEYGTATAYSGGVALKDPPITNEDFDVFKGLEPPTIKPALVGLYYQQYPVPALQVTTYGSTNFGIWTYGFAIPEAGMEITNGDTLEIFATNLTSAEVTGLAAETNFGGWMLDYFTETNAVFVATVSTTVTNGGDVALVDGFQIQSSIRGSGLVYYIETVAGSVGRLAGPAPGPLLFVQLVDPQSIVLSWSIQERGYSLEASPALEPPVWTPITNSIVETNNLQTVTLPAPGSPQFYRLIW
jgi:hypothetical protein